jgi:hypothetical protein
MITIFRERQSKNMETIMIVRSSGEIGTYYLANKIIHRNSHFRYFLTTVTQQLYDVALQAGCPIYTPKMKLAFLLVVSFEEILRILIIFFSRNMKP